MENDMFTLLFQPHLISSSPPHSLLPRTGCTLRRATPRLRHVLGKGRRRSSLVWPATPAHSHALLACASSSTAFFSISGREQAGHGKGRRGRRGHGRRELRGGGGLVGSYAELVLAEVLAGPQDCTDPQKDGGGGARGRAAAMVDGGGVEMDSPRFRAILRATSGRRKRAPDVKSFSHELRAGCGVPAMRKMVRGGGLMSTTPEEFIGAIRTKFIRLKEEVDSELGIFAGDLVDVLARAAQGEDRPPEEWRVALEDLLVVAQRCAEMSPEELWTRCEGVVQGLDDRRQELPAGLPKQAHTRILFILTRCTRLLQFRKGGAVGGCRYADVDDGRNVLGLHQLSDLGLYPIHVDGGDLGRKSTSSLTELKERLIRRRMLEHKQLTVDFSPARLFSPFSGDGSAAADGGHSPSGKIASWKKLPSPAEKNNISKNAAGAGAGDASGDAATATKAAAGPAAAGAGDDSPAKKKPITRHGKTTVDEIVERVDAASIHIHPDGLACLGGHGVTGLEGEGGRNRRKPAVR